MSNYVNFIVDYPSRCRDLLSSFEPDAVDLDREVTLVLSVASTGLTIPFERLKDDDGPYERPTDDRARYQDAAEQFDALLASPFLDSAVWGEAPGSWHTGRLGSAKGTPDDWPELRTFQQITPDVEVSAIVYTLRNALAHGNIYSRPDNENRIRELVFLSGGRKGKKMQVMPYQYVQVTPGDLQTFLLLWFDFLQQIKLPPGD